MITIILGIYMGLGLIITGFRFYNILQISSYIENFEDIVGGQIGLLETFLKTVLLWPMILIILLMNRR